MKLGLERCAELLVEIGSEKPFTYRKCPYTYRPCYSSGISCDGCFNNPATGIKFTTTGTTTSKED